MGGWRDGVRRAVGKIKVAQAVKRERWWHGMEVRMEGDGGSGAADWLRLD